MSWHRWRGDDLVLDLRVRPRASRDHIAGPLGDRLKVSITAPPVDGKANTHLRRYLAKCFGIAPSRVTIEAGENSRDKRVHIQAPRRLPPAIAYIPVLLQTGP